MTWFTDILNMFFTFLDRIVYGLITVFYELFLYLANLDLFGMSTLNDDPNNIIVNFSSRIYALLGIFMLFRVSFSILQYMVNPDDFSDKGKGFGKMITNILVSLVLIITVPYIFQKAFQIQGVILKDNFLGKLILGNVNSDNNPDNTTNQVMATDLQFLIYGTFFSVDTDVIPECETGPILGTKAMAEAGMYDENGNVQDPSSSNDTSCLSKLRNAIGNENKLGDFFRTDDPDNRRFDAFGEVVNTKVDSKYVFKYMPLISTVAGGFVMVMLLSFCLDLAVRVIKLGFLEIIAPIPIVSYMDPKQSGKDGMLGKWAKECGSTFLSLFIRIAIIYFTFFMVDLVANNVLTRPDEVYLEGVTPPSGLMAAFVQLMVILGIFFFAKEVPKLLENIIGIKASGSLHFDRIKGMALGTVGGLAGLGVGSIASAISTAKTAQLTGDNVAKAGLSGFFKGGVLGAFNGGKWDGKKVSSLFSNPLSVSGDLARYQAAKHGTTFASRARSLFDEAIGAPQQAELIKKRIDNADKYLKTYDAYDGGLLAKASKLKDAKAYSGPNSRRNYSTIMQYNNLKTRLDAAIARGDVATEEAIRNGTYDDGTVKSGGFRFNEIEDNAKQVMHDMIEQKTITNDSEIEALRSHRAALERIGKENASAPEFKDVDDSIYGSIKDMKAAYKSVKSQKTTTENSDEYENAQANAEAIKANRMFDHFRGK